MPAPDKKVTPLSRLVRLIFEDRREFSSLLIYSFLNSLLLLVVPLAAQGLVNVVVAGLFLQPLLVLSGALFLGLLFAGLLTVIRFYLVEIMRERVFARVALRVAERLPRVHHRALAEGNGPELMNRFFDVINVQKSWFKLAYNGPGAVLEIIVGLSLLALYGTELLALGVGLLVVGLLVVGLNGYNGLSSSLKESTEKYRVAEWLEEMVRCHDAMKLNSRPQYWAEETDRRVVGFLQERRKHFRILLRQHIAYYALAAIATAGMLGLGGYLVIQGQLTLGQLVAAELVVWSILKATEKLLGTVEATFDLLTGLHKVGYLTDMSVYEVGDQRLLPSAVPAKVAMDNVTFSYSPESGTLLKDFNLEVQSGEVVSILGEANSGKSTVVHLLAGLLRPQRGCVEIDEVDLRELSPNSLAENVALISGHSEVFGGSLMDNVAAGRHCDPKRLRDVLDECGGRSVLRQLPLAAKSTIVSGAVTLSASQRESILLGRSILDRPRLLLIDESLYHLGELQRKKVVETLCDGMHGFTVISTVALPELVHRSDKVYLLEEGSIVEQGSPVALSDNKDSQFRSKFPTLAAAVRYLNSGDEG